MTAPNVFLAGSLGILLFVPVPTFAQNAVASQTPVAVTAPGTPAPTGDRGAWETSEILNADLLKLEIVTSRTAQVFHVVDQLSQWSKTCHKQYIAYFGGANGSELSDDDRVMLQKHVAVREKHAWGQGLEQTFYSPLDIKAAAQEGVTAGRLTEEEAASEVEVLNYFAPRVDPLIEKEAPTLARFREQLKTERVPVALFTRQLSRFCGNRRYKVPVYLIVNPHEVNHGSGVAGGRIIVEVPRYGDTYTTLFRVILAAFVDQYTDEMNKAIVGVEDLDVATLEEALVNALVPGLLHPAGSDDVLLNRVARDMESKKPATDPAVRLQRYSLMLRPALAAALADKNQTMSTFLPQATGIWRSMNELQRAASTSISPVRASKTPSIFVFGSVDTTVVDYFQTGSRNLFSRPHQTEAYQEMLGKYSKPNDTVVLLVTSDTLSHIPTLFSDLLPMPSTLIQQKLDRGETVVMQGSARQFRIVLLAASKQVVLESLIRSNRALWQ